MNARALTENLAALLRREHDALAEFLIALADFDRRRLWVEMGHASLFYYLHRELRLSKGAAQYRKVAAELIQLVPGIVEPLRRGDLCLSSVIEAAKVVTPQNWQTVLPRFYGLSRREAMEVAAALHPQPAPPIRTIVTPVRSDPVFRSESSSPQALTLVSGGAPRALGPTDTAPAAAPLRVSSSEEPGRSLAAPSAAHLTSVRQVEVVPLTAEQSRLHLTVSKEFMRKLEAARDAMSNAMPEATPAEILEAGLELLLVQTAKRKGLVRKRPKNSRPVKDDHIPAQVRREVWTRDGGKCQWPVSSGGVCGATRRLELDHIHPRSMGGVSTAANLRVLCKSHNDFAARLALGDDLMNRYTSGLRGAARRPARANDSEPSASPP